MSNPHDKYIFYKIGFHGDEYLIKLVKALIMDCDLFIETGTNVGSTIAFISNSFPQVLCYSCEPDTIAYKEAVKNTYHLPNVTVYNENSHIFFKRLRKMNAFNKKVMFWLDAHGKSYNWPLKEEVRFITSRFHDFIIFIDDFKIPGFPCFGFDSYAGQECSFEIIKDYIQSTNYYLYYPIYTEKTSKHHPLRGWGLITSDKIEEITKKNLITYISKANKGTYSYK